MSAAEKYEIEEDRPSFTVIEGGLTFRRQVDALAPKLFPRALQLTRNASDAQDLVQDTVLRALRFEDHFIPNSNLRAWLNQILFSVFVTHCRTKGRERRAHEHLQTDPLAWTMQDGAPNMRSFSPRLEQALRELPESFSRTLLLVDVHELPYKDAAEALGIPIGTVMSRLHRARRMLRERLGEDAAA